MAHPNSGARARRAFAWSAVIAVTGVCAPALAQPRIPSELGDFYFYGHQPRQPVANPNPQLRFDTLVEPQTCQGCHGVYEEDPPPWEQYLPHARWQYSMMAQSLRDPIFLAQLQISNADASNSGDSCLKCHAPVGWAEKRNTPPDGSSLTGADLDGVSCSLCHRSVDPIEQPFPSPPAGTPPTDGTLLGDQDRLILENLGFDRPPNFATGGPTAANSFVLDNQDRRRGPFNLDYPGDPFFYHDWAQSPFHSTSRVCASCHDVSNPLFTRQSGGVYALNANDERHPTGNKYDMFPLDRLYSEWLASQFAQGPVAMTVPDPNGGPNPVGRYAFDGVSKVIVFNETTQQYEETNQFYVNGTTSYSTCQDCHMPDVVGPGCNPFLGRPSRPNMPQHNFSGVNSWVLRAVAGVWGGPESGLENPQRLDRAVQRNIEMQRKALDLEVTPVGPDLRVRIINQTGHKLPSGFGEGRRMWINVRFFNAADALIAERGAYNAGTQALSEGDTKVYQIKHGLDAAMAATAGLPAGPSFRIVLNNEVSLDNRIPPRGFTNANFAAVQAAPVGAIYADGQYWDDTIFTVPAGAVRADVRVFHQTTSREYIEFLRDNATAPTPVIDPPNPSAGQPIGQLAYNQWVAHGRSAPVEKAFASTPVRPCPVDIATAGNPDPLAGGDGFLTGDDFDLFVNAFFNELRNAQNNLIADIATAGSSDPFSGPDTFLTGEDFDAFVILFFSDCRP